MPASCRRKAGSAARRSERDDLADDRRPDEHRGDNPCGRRQHLSDSSASGWPTGRRRLDLPDRRHGCDGRLLQPWVPSSVSITCTKDGVDIYDPVTIEPDVLGCVNGRLPGLEAGHYKIVFPVPASEMPPLVGEFDETP